MSAQSRDHIGDLERHRLRLEEQVAKLRKSLQHWQTWDAEYEGLKEEIQGFKKTPNGSDPTAPEMIKLGHEFGGELVNEKEIKELLGKDMQRSATQVIDLISRRQDYVQKNVQTVQKQVDSAEDKLNKVLVIANPSLEDEEGGPLMDIREELDEEGNVLSSSISTPGQETAKLMETLKKAGIDLPEEEGEAAPKDTEILDVAEPTSTPDGGPKEVAMAQELKVSKGKAPVQAESSSSASEPEPTARKKSVSFTPDTKEPAEASGIPVAKSSVSAHMNFPPGTRVVELNDKDEIVGTEIAGSHNPGIQKPVIPENESEEDAKLRREMLEYSLNEVGNVVAELDLYEADSDDEDEYEEEDSDIEEVDEDDEWGRSTRPVVTEEYMQKMRELEKKLNASMIENLGPAPQDADLNNMLQQAQGVHKLVVRTDEEIPPVLLPKQPSKAKPAEAETDETTDKTNTDAKPVAKGEKGVRFADSLDVSPPPNPVAEPIATPSQTAASPEARPIADTLVERSGATSSNASTPSEPAPPRKASRFKSSRAAAAAQPPPEEEKEPTYRTTPTGPANATLASSVIERDHHSTATAPDDPDGLDPDTLSQQTLTEYHRMRAKLIQRQDGGFVRQSAEEEAAGPLVEEFEDGRVRKVSRFKAARVKREGEGEWQGGL